MDLDDERFTRETADIRDYLIRYAARLTHQRADAEDLVQETLLKAYLSFNSYREGTHLKSWLGRIMSNTWIDKHRSTQRRPAEQLSADVNDSWLAIGGSTVTNGSTESAEAVVLRLSPSDAERALHDLPEDLREIVYYACIAGYRNTEIADLLKMPVGTVGSRLHRGKALLRLSLTNPAAS
ncbi:RNA polymerase subunit sigma-70 [Mycolicibacterium canariasense]|nr:RNA polymerase subunit sigma-70 [Mycolicibacterium canariasense]